MAPPRGQILQLPLQGWFCSSVTQLVWLVASTQHARRTQQLCRVLSGAWSQAGLCLSLSAPDRTLVFSSVKWACGQVLAL